MPTWLRTALPLAWADLRARYAGSWLGAAWALLLPLLEVAAYAVLFGVLLGPRAGLDGPAFTAFVAAGLLPWGALREGLEGSAGCLQEQRWIRRSRVPLELLVARLTLAAGVRGVVGVGVVLAASLALPSGSGVSWRWALPGIALAAQTGAVFGLGLGLAPAAVLRPDLRPGLVSLLTLLTFASPIVYPDTLLPPALASLLDLNPYTHLLRLYRAPLGGPTGDIALSAAVALALPVVAWMLGAALRERLWWPARDRL